MKFKLRKAEIAALRNQINLHFVFNSLNSIQNFIFKKDVIKVNYFLTKFSTLIRNGLQYSRVEFISIHQEIQYLKSYLELESFRLPNKFEYTFIIDENLDTYSLMTPSLLLQPIIENVIKHAFNDITKMGSLEIKIFQKEVNKLHIYIIDNGPGLENILFDQNDKKNHSLGLIIIQERIELLNESRAKNKFEIKFINYSNHYTNTTGLEVQLILPIIHKQ